MRVCFDAIGTLEHSGGIDLRGTDAALGIRDVHVISDDTVVVLHDMPTVDTEPGKPSTKLQAVQWKKNDGDGLARSKILWSKRDELGGSISSHARIAGDAHRYVAMHVFRAGDCYLTVLDPLTGHQRATWLFPSFFLRRTCTLFPGTVGADELSVVVEEAEKESRWSKIPDNLADRYRRGCVIRMQLLTGEILSSHPFYTPRPSLFTAGFKVEHMDRRGWLYISLTTVAPGDDDDVSEQTKGSCVTEEIAELLGGPLPRPGRRCLFCACGLDELKQGVWHLLSIPVKGSSTRLIVDDSDPNDVTLYNVSALVEGDKEEEEYDPEVWSWTAFNATAPPRLRLEHEGPLTWQGETFFPFSSLLLRTGPEDQHVYVVDKDHSKMYVLV